MTKKPRGGLLVGGFDPFACSLGCAGPAAPSLAGSTAALLIYRKPYFPGSL